MGGRKSGCSCASLLDDIVQGDLLEVSTTCGTVFGDFEKIVNSEVIQLRNEPPSGTQIFNICCSKICSIRKAIPV